MGAPVERIAIAEAELEPWPIPSDQIRAGQPEATGALLSKSSDSTLASGVWECTPGAFVWPYAWDETCCILSGRATLRSAVGSVTEIGPGDICSIPRGSEVTWEVHERIRKGFCLFSPDGLPF